MSNFGKFLQDKILINTPKKELLIKLQLEHEEFVGLDSVTLANWVKGRSSPSLYKQLLIAQTCQCIPAYLDNFKEAKVSSSDERTFMKYINRIDSPYHQILASDNETYLFHKKGMYNELYPYVKPFSDKIVNLKKIAEQIRHRDIYAELLAVGTKDNKRSESFIWMLHGFDAYLDCMAHPGDKNEYSSQNCLAVTLTYYHSSEHFSLLCGIFVNLVLECYPYKKKLVIIFRGLEGLMLSEILGGQLIRSIPDSKYGNLYIHEFDVIRLFSNPLLLNIAKRYCHIYRDNFNRLISSPIKTSNLL
ncbi:TPA: hypothetical protein RQK05_004208 [Vibrio vulnificus]|nr:hypothetical protein [Vibrio vulnificus]HDY7749531.1 hypothetical protein [Vibrio vulnificus]HDY7758870.1 hypothetical protein [Vibrio vulnificus]HDY7763526.1 hypothetical protein [Vibrio vulnificus]HDY7772694.1 hypothetical protein [Vibrio vulnificus]